MGGFVDGIVFHQILQLHGMVSAVRPKTSLINVQVNMVWDGVFHACTWITTAAGIAMLFHAGKRAGRAWNGQVLCGAMVMGWGLFNLVEGTVDHHVLQLHHVVEARGLSVYDWLFLASGAAMIVGGWVWVRAGGGASTTMPDASQARGESGAIGDGVAGVRDGGRGDGAGGVGGAES
jgi:uncharacterized membrane protein